MSYALREAEIPVLPKGHAPIRILHFSDLHLTPARKEEIADIRSFAKYSPDLVISTGDFLADMEAVPVVLDALEYLLDVPGLYVFGSNDYYAPKPKNPLKYLLPDHGKRKMSGIYYAHIPDDVTDLNTCGTEFAPNGVDSPERFFVRPHRKTWHIYPSHHWHRPGIVQSKQNRFIIAVDIEIMP